MARPCKSARVLTDKSQTKAEINDRIERDISVHHIIPLAVDYSKRLDNDNLISLCHYHHERAESGEISPDRLRELAAIPPALSDP